MIELFESIVVLNGSVAFLPFQSFVESHGMEYLGLAEVEACAGLRYSGGKAEYDFAGNGLA